MSIKMKKWLSVLLAAMLLVGCLAGCGGQVESQETDPQEETNTPSAPIGEDADNPAGIPVDFDEEPAEVNWYLWNVGGSVSADGVQQVEDALNEITLKKINVKVHLVMMEMGEYLTNMAMQVSAGDKVDLITTFPAMSGSFTVMVNNHQLLDLNEYLDDYAPGIREVVPENVLQATTRDGALYGVPVYTDMTNDAYWLCRKAYLDEAGFTVDDIKDFKDLDKVYAKVHELHPEMTMISSGAKQLYGSAGALFTGATYDPLGTDIIAVMVDHEGAPKVVNIYETEEMKEVIQVLNEWYASGYINEDVAINDIDPFTDPKVFSGGLGGNKARTHNDTLAGEPMARVKLSEGYVTTSSVAIMNMAIPVSATEPEAAARLMELCYTDKDVKMLVSYGVEGVHYTYAENGGVQVLPDNTSYSPNTLGIFGNVFLCDPSVDDVKIGYDMRTVDQSKLKYSPLLGFAIDTSNVANELAQVSSVVNEFSPKICCGLGTQEDYDAFIAKLYDSGLQTYLDEVQHQLDEWWAANGK